MLQALRMLDTKKLVAFTTVIHLISTLREIRLL